ncbi:MAG: hypothetical protein WAT39_02490 [Planctomycetota bacterium]
MDATERPSGTIDQQRRAEYFTTLMRQLVEAGGSLTKKEALARLSEQLDLTPYELERTKTGGVRWRVQTS